MIRVHLSAAITVKDAFTGKPLEGKGISFSLDGERMRPEARPGGVYLLTNLAPGEHTLGIEGPFFQPELLTLRCDDAACDTRLVAMKPNEKYPFGGRFTRLAVQLLEKGKGGGPVAGAELCFAYTGLELKIAQDAVQAGETAVRLYLRGDTRSLQLPAQFLIQDGAQSEHCTLLSLEEESGTLQNPLRYAHKRGKNLLPCQLLRTDEEGRVRAYYKEPHELALFWEEKAVGKQITLEPGENELEWKL